MNKVEFKHIGIHHRPVDKPTCGYILLTGATGLVGQYLLRYLLEKNEKLAVLVRSTKKQTAAERIEAIMQRWESELGRSLPRPVVLTGDLSNANLSLCDDDVQWAKKHCDRVIHNAAILKFEPAIREGEPWKTNLEGTRNVVDFSVMHGLSEFHYVSTAYVSGLCEEFHESDLELNQEFRNDYERSKFAAEKLVRNTEGLRSVTVYRPGIIVGDSQTGYTASYHGLYVYLRLMATLIPHQQPDANGVRNTPIRMPVDADQPRNLVPVDWVAGVISEVVSRSELHELTYHLVPDERPTHRQILQYCYEYFNSDGVRFANQDDASEQYNNNNFAQQFLNNVAVYSAYDRSDPKFDNRNVKNLGPNWKCPSIDKEVIFRFLDFGESDRWGKRKVPKPEAGCWLENNGSTVREIFGHLQTETPTDFINLEIRGPSGGDWTISSVDGEIQFTRGISTDSARTIVIDSATLSSLTSGEIRDLSKHCLTNLSAFDSADQNLSSTTN